MSWPMDADGDVFRRMQSSGFDFSIEHEIDFSVDFDRWPPPPGALPLLQSQHADARVVDREVDPATRETYGGYIAFRVRALLTYELVMRIQSEVTRAMLPFGGRCESWGVMQR